MRGRVSPSTQSPLGSVPATNQRFGGMDRRDEPQPLPNGTDRAPALFPDEELTNPQSLIGKLSDADAAKRSRHSSPATFPVDRAGLKGVRCPQPQRGRDNSFALRSPMAGNPSTGSGQAPSTSSGQAATGPTGRNSSAQGKPRVGEGRRPG